MLRHHYPIIPFGCLVMKRHHYPIIPCAPCSGKSRFDLVYILYILTVSTLLLFTLYTRELLGCLLGILSLGKILAGAIMKNMPVTVTLHILSQMKALQVNRQLKVIQLNIKK